MASTRLLLVVLAMGICGTLLAEASLLKTATTREEAVRDIQGHSALRRSILDQKLKARSPLKFSERLAPPTRVSEQVFAAPAPKAFWDMPPAHSAILSISEAASIADSLDSISSAHVSLDDLPEGHHEVSLTSSSDGGSLLVRFESGLIPDVHFPCDRVHSVHFLGASHAPLHFQLFNFPACFAGDFSIVGRSGEDSIEIMEDIKTTGKLDFDVHSFSTRATIPCGITVNSGTPVSAGPSPTSCSGPTGIEIIAPEILVATDLSTEDGNIDLTATGAGGFTNGVTWQGGCTITGAGTLIIDSTAAAQSTAVFFDVTSTLSVVGDINIFGTGGAVGVRFSGSVNCVGFGVRTANIVGFGLGVIDSVGVEILGSFLLDNYQGSISGTTVTSDPVACTGVRISTNAFGLSGTGQFFSVAGLNNCASTSNIHRGIEILPSTLGVSNVDFVLDGETSGVNAPNSVGVLVNNLNSNIIDSDVTIRATADALTDYTGLEIINSNIQSTSATTFDLTIIAVTNSQTGINTERVRFTNTTVDCNSFNIDATTGAFEGGDGNGAFLFNSDITANNLAIQSGAGLGGVGVTIRRTDLSVAGPITLDGEGGRDGGLTRGVVLDSSSITGTSIDITGTVIAATGSDHKGVYMFASNIVGTLQSSITGDASLNTGGVDITGVQFAQSVDIDMGGDLEIDGFGGDNGAGIKVETTSTVDFVGTVVVTMTGVCRSQTIVGTGVQVDGELSVDTAMVFFLIGDSSLQLNPYPGIVVVGNLQVSPAAVVSLTGAGASTSNGIDFGGTIVLGTGSALAASGTGGAGGGTGIVYSNTINTPLNTCQLSLTGIGGGSGSSSLGVLWTPSSGTYGEADISITGTGGGVPGSTDNSGVRFDAPLFTTGAVDVAGTGGAGSSGAIGTYVRATITGSDVSLAGTGGPGGDNAQGCRIEANVIASGVLAMDGIASSSGLNPNGVYCSAMLQSGANLDIDGLATGSDSGCRFEGASVLSSGVGGTNVNCVGVDYGIFMDNSASFQNVGASFESIVVDGTSTGAAAVAGVLFGAPVNVPVQRDFFVTGTASTNGVGILALSDIVGLDTGQFLSFNGMSSFGNGITFSAGLDWDGPATIIGTGTASGLQIAFGQTISGLGPFTMTGTCAGIVVDTTTINSASMSMAGSCSSSSPCSGVRVSGLNLIGSLMVTGNAAPSCTSSCIGIEVSGGALSMTAGDALSLTGTGGGTAGLGNDGVAFSGGSIFCGGTGCTPFVSGTAGFQSAGVSITSYVFQDTEPDLSGTSGPTGSIGTLIQGSVIFNSGGSISLAGTSTDPGGYGIACVSGCDLQSNGVGNILLGGSGAGSFDVFLETFNHPNKAGGLIEFDGTVEAPSFTTGTGPYSVAFRSGGTIGPVLSQSAFFSATGAYDFTGGGTVQGIVSMGAGGATSLGVQGGTTLTFQGQFNAYSATVISGPGSVRFEGTCDGPSELTLSNGVNAYFQNSAGISSQLASFVSDVGTTTVFDANAGITADAISLSGDIGFLLSSTHSFVGGAISVDSSSSSFGISTMQIISSSGVTFAGGPYVHSETTIDALSLSFSAVVVGDVTVEGDTAVTFFDSSASQLFLQDNATASFAGGASCIGTNSLVFLDDSEITFNIDGDTACLTYGQFALVTTTLFSSGASAFLTTAGTVIRGTDYRLIDFVGMPTGAEFTNLPTGFVSILGGVPLTISYPGSSLVAHANQLPVALSDTFSYVATSIVVEPAPGVLFNDMDPEGSTLSASLVAGPGSPGNVIMQPDGGFTFFPAVSFEGPFTFTYVANDGLEDSIVTTVFGNYVNPSATPTTSPSLTPSITATPSITLSPTGTPSPTKTATTTVTPSPTRSPSDSNTKTISVTSSVTPSQTASVTRTRTVSPSSSASISFTRSVSTSVTSSVSLSGAPPPTPSNTPQASIAVNSPLPTIEPSGAAPSQSRTQTVAPSPSCTANCSPEPTNSSGAGASGSNGGSGSVPTEVTTISGNGDGVPVFDSDGNEVGEVMINDGSDGILVVSSPDDTSEVVLFDFIVTPVLDIRVFGEDGTEKTQFSGSDVEICFARNGIDPDDVCLGFFNDEGNWECEDYCLDETSAGICGKSDHLTNFALLLSADAGSDSKCGSTDGAQLVYVYLSIALVACACVTVILGAVLVEVRIRWKRRQINSRLTVRTVGSSSP